MRVMISFADSVEFEQEYRAEFGKRPELLQDFMVNRGPAEQSRMGLFDVPDDSRTATWIRLAHPDWIDYFWKIENT